jgi:hypothetical protein
MTREPFQPVATLLVRTGRATVRLTRSRWARRAALASAVMVVGVLGVAVGLILFSRSDARVGPLLVRFETRLALDGGSEIVIPPLGSLWLDSHSGPLRLNATVIGIDQQAAEDLISEPTKLDQFSEDFLDDLQGSLLRTGIRSVGAGTVMGLVLSALVFRNVRRVAWSGSLCLVIGAGSVGLMVGTMRPDSIGEPRYSGLLVNAPAVVGDARRILDGYDAFAGPRRVVEEYDAFSGGLAELLFTANIAYERVVSVPDLRTTPGDVVVLHISDLRSNVLAWSVIKQLVTSRSVSAVLDTGDTTALGAGPESQFLISQVRSIKVPYVYVRGDQDSPATVRALRAVRNVRVLDGDVVPIGPLRITGIPSPLRDLSTRKELSESEQDTVRAAATALNDRVLGHNTSHAAPVNVAMMHEPEGASEIAASVPLILSGVRSGRSVTALDDDTLLMQQGRSGSVGVLGQNATGQHFVMSLLYFTPQGRLRAYEDLVIYGPDQARVEVQRYLVP